MWFNRRRNPRIHDEVRFHRDRLIEDYMAAGMSRPDAERRAFIEFGNLTQIEEGVKDVRGRWVEDFRKDVLYALRTLRRSPVFACASILTLCLGMGASAALMTVTRGVLTRALPVERPDELVEVGCINPRNPEDACRIHYPGFLLFRDRTDILSGVFAFAPAGDLAAGIDGRTEVVSGLFLSANAYTVLGLAPHAGRLLNSKPRTRSTPCLPVSEVAVRVPNAERAIIASEKLTGYLLNLSHRRGAARGSS